MGTRKRKENLPDGSTDAVLPLKDLDSALIRNDSELKELAMQLETTAPADPAFREFLLARLLGILRERQAPQGSEKMADMGYEEPDDGSGKAR